MRLVNADALKEATKHYTDSDGFNPVWWIIDNAPLIDIPIRFKGEWEHWHSDNFLPEDIWKCSYCKAEFYTIPDTWNYCPICGAKMQKGGTE